jgi:hypothetical protein
MKGLKKIIFFSLFVTFSYGIVYGQLNYSVDFSKNDLVFRNEKGYDIVEVKGLGKMDGKNVKGSSTDFKIGNPSLPEKDICLVIPQNTSSYSITITSMSTEPIFGTFEIIPQQHPKKIRFSLEEFIEPDSGTYGIDAFFPKENAGIIYSGAYHGTSLAYISVIPFRYNPVQKRLELITHIDFTLNLKSQKFSSKKRATQEWVNDKNQFLHRLVNNPQEVNRFMYIPEIVDKSYFSRPRTAKIVTTPAFYEYVVITSSGLASYFDPFVKWLKRKGIDAGVVTVTDIESTYEGDADGVPESAGGSIRAYLKDGYVNHNTDWALLGGDENVVDTFYGVGYGFSPISDDYQDLRTYCQNDWQSYIIPTDLYYAEFSGHWEEDSDGHYGELEDDDPGFIPNISIGRLPCDSSGEVQNWILKVLKYSQSPGNGNGSYLQKAYSVAADQLTNQPSSNDTIISSAGFTTHDKTVESPADTSYVNIDVPGEDGGKQIIDEMNQHYGIYNWHCHGSPCWFAVKTGTTADPDGNPHWTQYNGYDKSGVFSLDSKTSSNYLTVNGDGLDNMTNKDYYSVVYSLCCDIAAYDDYVGESPCMAESWTLLAQKCGPVLFGNTRSGWVDISWDLQEAFYDALYDGYKQAGKALNTSKSQITDKYLLYSNNLFGDPELSIWTTNPSEISPTITINSTSVAVNANMAGCTIALSSYDFTTSMVQTNVSQYTFTTSVRPLFIVITKSNYLPYIAVTGGSLAENQTWGDEFTNLTVLGDITVPSGKTLTINSGTTIKVASGIKIDVYGTLNLYSALLTRSGGSNWSGLDIRSGGAINALADTCKIEYANVGIDILGGTLSNGDNTLIIRNCQNAGIYADNYGTTIRNVKCQGITTNYGGFMVSGSSANAILRRDTVETSIRGLYVSVNTEASMDSCDIKDTNTDHSILFTGGGKADLYGYNNIDPASGKKAIYNEDSGSISAQSNYWGVVTPTDALFQYPARVTYTPFYSAALTAGVYKTIQEIEKPQRKIALDMELNGDFKGAYSIYSDLFSKEQKPEWRKFFITSMLRVCDKFDRNYDDLRSKITQELLTATGIYRGSLDFILCDILYREGRYNDAVTAFKEKAANYHNDQTAVEMYTRISEIYSNYLNDKASGIRYADMAKAINPGSPALRLAYEFAGSSYDPTQYTDIYGIGATKPEPEAESKVVSDFVEVFPNPANPTTTISYSLSSPSKVNLTIYNISGQKVATLVDGPISSGVHAVKFDGSRYGSGLYFYRFASDKFTKTGKMLLLK